MNIIIYAEEDHTYLKQLLQYLPDAQAVPISQAMPMLQRTPLHFILLFMSIDLLFALLCKDEYSDLYQRLKLYEREGLIIVVYLSSCAWVESFSAPVFPNEKTIRDLSTKKRAWLYQKLGAYLARSSENSLLENS